jgi:hypothetical protein
MSQTTSTVVACVNSVSCTAETARTEWSAVRRTHERLEALCASEGTEAAEETAADPLLVLGACVHFVTSSAEYVARHAAEGRHLPAALRVLVAERLAGALLEGPHAAVVRAAFPVLQGDSLRAHLRQWVLHACAEALERTSLGTPDATGELLVSRALLAPASMPALVEWFFARRMAAVARIEAAADGSAGGAAEVGALRAQLAELLGVLHHTRPHELKLLGGAGRSGEATEAEAEAEAEAAGAAGAAGAAVCGARARLLEAAVAAPLGVPLAGCCTPPELLALVATPHLVAPGVSPSASATLGLASPLLRPPAVPPSAASARLPELRSALSARVRDAAARLLQGAATEADLHRLLSPPPPAPVPQGGAAEGAGAEAGAADGAEAVALRGELRVVVARVLRESLEPEGAGAEGAGAEPPSRLLSLLARRIEDTLRAAVPPDAPEAMGGVALAWQAAEAGGAPTLAHYPQWQRGVCDTLGLRMHQARRLLDLVETFSPAATAPAALAASGVPPPGQVEVERAAAAAAAAYGAACVVRLLGVCTSLLERDTPAEEAAAAEAAAGVAEVADDAEAAEAAEAAAAYAEREAEGEAAAAAVRLVGLSTLLAALATQHARHVAALQPGASPAALPPASVAARREALSLQLRAVEAAAAQLCAPIAPALRRASASWVERMGGAGGGGAQLSWRRAALYGAAEAEAEGAGAAAHQTLLLPHAPSEHVMRAVWGLVSRLRRVGVGGLQPRLLCAVLRHARAAFAVGLRPTVSELRRPELADAAMQMQLDLVWLRVALCERHEPEGDATALLGLPSPRHAAGAGADGASLEQLADANSGCLDPISWAVSEAPLQARALASLAASSALLGALNPDLTTATHAGAAGAAPPAATLRLAPPCARFGTLPLQTPPLRTRRALLAALGEPSAAGGGAAMADSLGEGYDDDSAAGGGGTLMSKLGVMMRSEEMRDISSGVSSGVSSLLASTRLATNMVGGTTNLSTNLGGARSMLASAQRGAGAALPPPPHTHTSTAHPPPHPPRSAFLGPSHAVWRAGVAAAVRMRGGSHQGVGGGARSCPPRLPAGFTPCSRTLRRQAASFHPSWAPRRRRRRSEWMPRPPGGGARGGGAPRLW